MKLGKYDIARKLLAMAMLMACAIGHAQESHLSDSQYSAEYIDCNKKAGNPGFYDQSVSARCDEAEIRYQKRRINTAYQQILKLWADDPKSIEKLNLAQKSWIQWRDQTADLLAERGGTSGVTAYVFSSGFLLGALVDQANLLERLVAANGG